jgi:hypothetical protein
MILLFGLLAWADPPTAADPLQPDARGLAMRARPIADGLVRAGGLAAVDVTLVNLGPDAAGELTIRERVGADLTAVDYRRSVELAKGSKKRVTLPLVVGMDPVHPVQLNLGDRGLERQVVFRTAPDTAVTVAVIGEDALGIQALGKTWGGFVPGPRPRQGAEARDVMVGLIDPDALPDRSAVYRSFDWVVWPKPKAGQLDPARIDALLGWVADGGHLFVTVSDNAAAVAASPLADALPVTLAGVADQSLVGLGPWVHQTVPDAVAPVAVGVPRDVPGRDRWVWAEAGGAPLLTASGYGAGTVHVLLADPAIEPLAHGVDRASLWRRLLWLPPPDQSLDWYDPSLRDSRFAEVGDLALLTFPPIDAWASGASGEAAPAFTSSPEHPIDPIIAERLHLGASSLADASVQTAYGASTAADDAMRAWLSQIPGVSPLPTSWLMVFSVLYLLVIGPFDWFVLRALRREPWTWVTYPAYIVLFSGAALGATAWFKGGQAAAVRIELVDMLPGTPYWRGDDYLGLFSTARTSVRLRAGFDNATVAPMIGAGALWDPEIAFTDGASASWRAETWTLAFARSQWVARAPGAVTVTRDGDNWLVTNDTDAPLAAAAVQWYDKAFALGPVAARSTARFPAAVPYDPWNSGPVDLRQPVATPDLLGWAITEYGNRATLDRGLLDGQYAHPSLLAVVGAPIEPLDVTGLEHRETRVTVLRAPVAADLFAGLSVPQVSATTGRHLDGGTKVQLVSVGPNDSLFSARTMYEGKSCWVLYGADVSAARYFANVNLLCDGQTASTFFTQVRLRAVAPPRPTGYISAGNQVRIDEFGPDDSADRKYLGATCVVVNLYGSDSFYAGEVRCGDASVYLNRAWLTDLGAGPSPFTAPYNVVPAVADYVRIASTTSTELDLLYPVGDDPSNWYYAHISRLSAAGWFPVTSDDAARTAVYQNNGQNLQISVTSAADGVHVRYTGLTP